ncbi:MAG: hypothetical protein KGD61_11010 [Candidatus Lokiarchaeota archaeon]|nr:hypothetical protein [Candidatus Lokiarchaeota archaeon]
MLETTRFIFRKTLDPYDKIVEIDTLKELTRFILENWGRVVVHCGALYRTGNVTGLKLILTYVLRSILFNQARNLLQTN